MNGESSETGSVLIVRPRTKSGPAWVRELEARGYTVEHATGGEEALAHAAGSPPDVILLDVNRSGPGLDEVHRRIAAEPTLACIPVVLLTADEETDTVVKGLAAGAHDVLVEPSPVPTVLARIRAAVRLKKAFDNEREMTKKVEAQAELLRELSITDPLTGLYNRRHFEEQAAGMLRLAYRNGRPVSCLMMDIDHFQQINDRHGHAMGDRVLKELAHALAELMRDSDLIARHGGEEFAAILPETDSPGAVVLAERIRNRIGELRVEDVTLSVSIGISTGPAGLPCSIERLLHEANEALDRAKRGGRDRVMVA